MLSLYSNENPVVAPFTNMEFFFFFFLIFFPKHESLFNYNMSRAC
jgi:hypothetical protein